MKKSYILLFVCPALFSMCVITGCCGPSKKTPGAFDRNSAKELLEQYRNLFEKKSMLLVGHAAGDYRNYPIEANNKLPQQAHTIGYSMRLSFDAGINAPELDGIEIDVQVDNNGTAYILHNSITSLEGLDEPARSFMRNNSLNTFLKLFIENKYYQKKYVFIEIKCPDSEKISPSDEAMIKTILSKIHGDVSILSRANNADESRIKDKISFVSFNYDALKYIADVSNGKEYGGVKYPLYLIVATNTPLGRIAKCVCPEFNFLDDTYQKKIVDSEFLTGIWFDHSLISRYGRVFNDMNAARELKNSNKIPPLVYFISTYKTCAVKQPSKLKEKIIKEKFDVSNLKGFIFDINTPR
jgi:hypothetical protein